MIIETPTAPAPAPADVSSAPTRKPGSAVCCHALSFLCLIGAAGTLVAALTGSLGFAGGYISLGCFAGAVLWWALGDIVASLARIARK